MDLSIVIPIYNEEGNIPVLFERLSAVANKLGLRYELIFVNDGSRDTSIQLIKALSLQHETVKFVDFSRNFGHQIAVTAGLDHSTGKAIVIIDADLQDPPEVIETLYQKMQEGFEVVYAKRKTRKGESRFKLMTAKLFYRALQKITPVDIPVDTGDFRIIDRRVVDVLRQMPEQNKFLRGQISWIGFRQTFIEYDRDERLSGETGYPFSKMLNFALDGITAFSNFPLKLVTTMGFFVSGVSFLVMLYALYSKFIIKDYEPGWTSLMISIVFLGGIQLISVGIIGEYISRINNDVRKRPLYIVAETNLQEPKEV